MVVFAYLWRCFSSSYIIVVVDSERVCSGNVSVQSTHPGPQPRPRGISTYGSETTVRERKTAGVGYVL